MPRSRAPTSNDPLGRTTTAVEAADTSPLAEGGLVRRVLGVVEGSEHPVATRQQLTTVRTDQLFEGLGVT
jgi:hypothetical protein